MQTLGGEKGSLLYMLWRLCYSNITSQCIGFTEKEGSVFMASIKDVAKKANVGIATVSRVINNSGFVSKETREIVFQAIEALGYTPNEVARSFQKKQTNMIGLIIPSIMQSFTNELTYSLEKELYNLGYHTLLCISNYDGIKELEYLGKLKSQQVAGVIITAPFMTSTDSYQYQNLPIVSVDRYLNKMIPCVHTDNQTASSLITEKLLARSVKKVAYIGFGADQDSLAQKRVDGFQEACIRQNRPYQILNTYFEEPLSAYLKRVFDMTQDCDGYFFGCDYYAHKFISLMHMKHKAVGTDYYLVSFDGLSTNKDYPYTLTCVKQSFEKLSQAVVQTLMKRINNTEVASDILVEYELIEGDTC